MVERNGVRYLIIFRAKGKIRYQVNVRINDFLYNFHNRCFSFLESQVRAQTFFILRARCIRIWFFFRIKILEQVVEIGELPRIDVKQTGWKDLSSDRRALIYIERIRRLKKWLFIRVQVRKVVENSFRSRTGVWTLANGKGGSNTFRIFFFPFFFSLFFRFVAHRRRRRRSASVGIEFERWD